MEIQAYAVRVLSFWHRVSVICQERHDMFRERLLGGTRFRSPNERSSERDTMSVGYVTRQHTEIFYPSWHVSSYGAEAENNMQVEAVLFEAACAVRTD